MVCMGPRVPAESVGPRPLSGVVMRPLNFTVRSPQVRQFLSKLRWPQALWARLLLNAGVIFVAWVGCLALGVGAATLGERLFGCHISEGGDGGCPVLGGISGLALLGAFGAPLFILGILVCVLGSGIAFVFRRR